MKALIENLQAYIDKGLHAETISVCCSVSWKGVVGLIFCEETVSMPLIVPLFPD